MPAHRTLLVRLAAAAAMAWVAWFAAAQVRGAEFRAGAFAADLTPLKFPISVNGGMRDRQATSAHDPIRARCLVLDDGRTKLAIVVTDFCMIPREICDEAKRLAAQATGIPAGNMLISATHTHEAPTLASVFQSDPDMEYVRDVPARIAKGIQQAHDNLVPARIGWGVGQDPTQVFNRRWKMKPGKVPMDPFNKGTDLVKMNPGRLNPDLVEPAGPVDAEVSIVAVQTRSGQPLAVLANYSLHYVGDVAPLSADYFGAFAERLTSLLGAEQASPAFVGIMSNGTSADINNVNCAAPAPPRVPSFGQCTAVAESVAQVAAATIKKIDYRDTVELRVAQREIELGVRLPTEAEVSEAEKIVAAAKTPIMESLREIYARETVLLAKYPPTVRGKLQAMRIGELGIVSTPCETFVDIGLAIKRTSPLRPTFTISLANGYNGYLPTPEQHALGGYETWRARSSYLEVDASTKVVRVLQELLAEVAQ